MLILNKTMQREIFRSDVFYLQTLEDILDCLVQEERYEKAAEVRDLIIYEKIEDPEDKKVFREELINKYTKNPEI